MGCIYIDTGAMYRAMALKAQRRGISFDALEAPTALASKTRIDLRANDATQQVLLDGEDVTGPVHKPEVAQAASKVAVVPGVRKVLVADQRRAGGAGRRGDGRTRHRQSSFPEADLRIFLTGSPEIRAAPARTLAKRRRNRLGAHVVEIHERDRRAASTKYRRWSRRLTPWVVDSTAMEAEEVARLVVMLTQELAKEEEMRLDSAAE